MQSHQRNPFVRGADTTLGSTLLLCLGLAASACSSSDDLGEEAIASDTQALINGANVSQAANSYGLVAVYHQRTNNPSDGWYPRPCTGTVIVGRYAAKVVLTARHCLMVDGEVEGEEVLTNGNLLITGLVNPGPNPPPLFTGAVPPFAVDVPPVGGGFPDISQTLDMGLLWVEGAIPGLSTPAVNALSFASSGDYAAVTGAWIYGYGGFVWDDYATAGRLRWGVGHNWFGCEVCTAACSNVCFGFSGGSGSTGYDWHKFRLSNGTNGEQVTGGDSGGPSFWAHPNNHSVIIGVHSGAASQPNLNWETALSRVNNQFIQSVIGRVYITPHSFMHITGGNHLTRSSNASGATVTPALPPANGDNKRQWWLYDFPKRRLRTPASVGNLCLAIQGTQQDGASVAMATCSTSASQRWFPGLDNLLRTTGGFCLNLEPNNTLKLRTCSAAVQSGRFYFQAESGTGAW